MSKAEKKFALSEAGYTPLSDERIEFIRGWANDERFKNFTMFSQELLRDLDWYRAENARLRQELAGATAQSALQASYGDSNG